MRYAQGGGLTDAGRAARERVRLQAVERFEDGQKNREIAAALRVSERSVERWRRQWRERGEAGVLSKGSPGRPRLSEAQITRLERELERGPLAHGWADQRWTLARIKTLIGRLFHVSYTVVGTWLLLKRHGWSWQQPARRAIERDEAGQSMTPPRARSWGRKGSTPVVRVRGRGSGRVSMAGLTCYKPGKRSRMFYSVREYRGRKGEPKGIGWRDLCDLLVRAHIQLGGPIVLVWDNLRMHLVEPMRQFIADHADWLTVFQLPSYSPDLNPQEGIWSLVKRDIGNLAAADLGQITRAVKRRLKQIQYRPDLVDGCLVGTGLITDG
ncbi:helix-turn-helix domain-containing protein [Streptomyces griseus]|uniref:transposase n=1 Tax=Streptomyces griseus TaxID=1911 RepID=UPI0013BE1690|nr:helix-turn-helix domain-containing protein [Streptomyces griseus]